MTELTKLITEQIKSDGPMTLNQYMALCLTHPEHGYYTSKDPFGITGDFITAPEISQIFGELTGLWLASQWMQQGKPDPFILCELGPGRGTLMADILRAGRNVPGFVEAAKPVLVEISPTLAEIQKSNIDHPEVSWTNFGDIPQGPLFLIANEFFDALPIRQFRRSEQGWNEVFIATDEDEKLIWALSPDEAPTDALPPEIQSLGEGAIIEICPSATVVMAGIAERINSNGGVALIIDYGYETYDGKETFRAIKGHGHVEPLAEPGKADLTAFVNFTTLAGATGDSGVSVQGPVTQSAFLLSMGAQQRAEMLMKNNPGEAGDIETGIRRLIDPKDMGDIFKAIAILPDGTSEAPGF